MARIAFQSYKPTALATDLITKAVVILEEYHNAGYVMTLRMLYYQLVSRDWLPGEWADPATGSTNNLASYKKFGTIISRARTAGFIDWDFMVDNGRKAVEWQTYGSPQECVEVAMEHYNLDRWLDQPYHVEVAAEKDAVTGIIKPVCNRFQVPFSANRGYTSSSAAFEMANRMRIAARNGKTPVLIYLGDHDPSGIDMSRDLLDRIQMFLTQGVMVSNGLPRPNTDELYNFEVYRIALNYDQVEKYDPPPNPAKVTDSRAGSYISKFGESCWELDALEPSIMDRLTADAIRKYMDKEKYAAVVEQEKKDRDTIEAMLNDLED